MESSTKMIERWERCERGLNERTLAAVRKLGTLNPNQISAIKAVTAAHARSKGEVTAEIPVDALWELLKHAKLTPEECAQVLEYEAFKNESLTHTLCQEALRIADCGSIATEARPEVVRQKTRLLSAMEACRRFQESSDQDEEAAIVALRRYALENGLDQEPLRIQLVHIMTFLVRPTDLGLAFLSQCFGDEDHLLEFVTSLCNVAKHMRLDWTDILHEAARVGKEQARG